MALLFNSLGQYKASLYETARGLLRSRNKQAELAQCQARLVNDVQSLNDRLAQELRDTKSQLEQTQQQLRWQQRENENLRQQPITLPSDLPLPHHTYGPKMISLCLNLSKKVGFRPAEAAMKLIFEWLQIQTRVPSWDSMRSWACRVGIARLQELPEQGDDWIWMADHSNQIGSEKVLVILGIRLCQLPPPGKTLRREDMHVLAVVPGTDWKREDVRREYKTLAERIGSPRYLLTDGAVELRESADVLGKPGEKTIVLRDMKHFAANTFEKLIGKSEQFTEYLSQLGRTRCQIQQTELSHFAPPPQKPKARFMNLGPTLRWGQMISHHLSNAHSRSRRGVSAARMKEKLGWVKKYRKELACWNRCEAVMQTSLALINQQGLYRGSAAQLEEALGALAADQGVRCKLSETMATKLIEFVRESEALLHENDRAWLSTENLESCFGLFKGLEGQHSKGGFTSLLAAMPMLLTDWTADRVHESLKSVSVKKMKAWVSEKLGSTLASKRVTAYREFASATSG